MRAAERLIPVSLELGGKDPMIVLRDADLERAANMAVQWAMSNSGQICISVERVYVEEPVYDEFVAEGRREDARAAPGRPGRAGHDRRRRDDVPAADRRSCAATSRTRRQGRAGAGRRQGRATGPGQFFEPTVLTGVDHTMKIMTEETFGPTLPIMKVRDADEAVRLANDSRYGLNSSVFSKDIAKGERSRAGSTAGNACVNDALMNYLALEAPFGGANESGLGARHGAAGHPQVLRHADDPGHALRRRSASRRCSRTRPGRRRLFERLMVLMWGRRRKRRR